MGRGVWWLVTRGGGKRGKGEDDEECADVKPMSRHVSGGH